MPGSFSYRLRRHCSSHDYGLKGTASRQRVYACLLGHAATLTQHAECCAVSKHAMLCQWPFAGMQVIYEWPSLRPAMQRAKLQVQGLECSKAGKHLRSAAARSSLSFISLSSSCATWSAASRSSLFAFALCRADLVSRWAASAPCQAAYSSEGTQEAFAVISPPLPCLISFQLCVSHPSCSPPDIRSQ